MGKGIGKEKKRAKGKKRKKKEGKRGRGEGIYNFCLKHFLKFLIFNKINVNF